MLPPRRKPTPTSDSDCLLQLAVLAAQLPDFRGLAAGNPRRRPLINLRLADPLAQRLPAYPQSAAAVIAVCCDSYSPACSRTSRIALVFVSWLAFLGMNVTTFPA